MKESISLVLVAFPFLTAACCALVALFCHRYGSSVIVDEEDGQESSESFQTAVAEKIDERVDAIIESVKNEIPMANMFLSQARQDKMKQQACQELYKIIPELATLSCRKKHIKAIMQPTRRYLLFATAVGALFGSVLALILFLLVG